MPRSLVVRSVRARLFSAPAALAMAAPDVPATMTGFVFTADGGMKLDAAAPVPVPKAKQVLVKVHAAGLNPVRRGCVAAP